MTEAEKLKRQLSDQTSAILDFNHDGQTFHYEITRAEFENLTKNLFGKCETLLKAAMKNSKSVATIDEVILVGGSTRMPGIKALVQRVTKLEVVEKKINPDLAVSAGAAYHIAAIVGQGSQSVVLLDVTPLGLGIETSGQNLTAIIKKDTPVPIRRTKTFTTAADNQTSVEIKIYESDRLVTYDLKHMDSFVLSNIPPKPKGEVKIDVTFEIDFNGMLKVTAECADNGQSESLVVKDSLHMTDEQLEAARLDAEKHREADERHFNTYKAKMDVETLANSYLKSLTTEEAKANANPAIVKACKDALDWLEANDAYSQEQYEEKFEELKKIMGSDDEGYASGGDQPPSDDEDYYNL